MSFISMASELRATLPNLPFDFTKTLINRAWKDVRRQNLWSFQLYEGPNWIAPPLINTGTVEVEQGNNDITFDATALAALIAGTTSYSAITQRQFRVQSSGSPWGTIYNIYAWDEATGIATLDRPFAEQSGIGLSYSVYQLYYAAPYEDHLTFLSVRDMTNFNDLKLNKTRMEIDSTDPQRTFFYFPTHVVYYTQDNNTDSLTWRYPLYELWGAPTYLLSWQLYGIRKYPDLVVNSDTLPPSIGEDCVLAKAKYYAYQWGEANKGALPRNQGPDFRFLMGAALKEYMELYKEYRRQDRETVNNWFSTRRCYPGTVRIPYYSTYSNTASLGGGWW